ncbi:MAG: GSCFA domain-containing protein [Reichenbachiella sp.]
MSNFRTELHIEENPDKIEYNAKILSLGSGFSNILMDQFSKFGFQVLSNPYGTIYNPLSIFESIGLSVANQAPDPMRITQSQDQWNHFDFHSLGNNTSESQLINALKASINSTNNYLRETGFLFMTFGSAYAYRHNPTGKIVANCHRAPRKDFDKVLLSVEEIVEGFRSIYGSLNNVKNIILMVSPIMHTGDSITLNSVSKSTLRLACHQILSEFPHVKYFPALEFLTSDLRGYQFYNKDLIHPTDQAMDYIFEKMIDAYVDEASKKLISEVKSIIDELDDSPYNPQSENYKNKIQKALEKIEALNKEMDLSGLLKELKNKAL